MRIGGFQKFTMVDYPGKVAATVFTVGCNFRCHFCHNPELVLEAQFPAPDRMEEEFFEHLEKRKGKLDGVCITGGEPTIQPGIIEFIRKIKKLGYLVKLDSNGMRPDVLKLIMTESLVDYIAMDIKHAPEKYSLATGVNVDMDRVNLSVQLIMQSGVPYEFRTTVVPGIHEDADFDRIAAWIKGAKSYSLQEYREMKILNQDLKKQTKDKQLDLDVIAKRIGKNFSKMTVRKNN